MSLDLYKEFILDLYRHPLNKKRLSDFDTEQKGINVSCGDELTLFVKFGKNKKIEDIGFEGQGCAISQAAASLLTEKVKGMSIKKVLTLSEKDIMDLLQTEIIYTRKKCAMLCLNTLQELLRKK